MHCISIKDVQEKDGDDGEDDDDVEVDIRVSDESIDDVSFLSASSQEMCKGLPVFWGIEGAELKMGTVLIDFCC